MWNPGLPELLIICVLGLLIFGKRLPEVARNLGKGITEFKKGVKGIEDDADRTANRTESTRSAAVEPTPAPTAQAFEPPKETSVASSDEQSS